MRAVTIDFLTFQLFISKEQNYFYFIANNIKGENKVYFWQEGLKYGGMTKIENLFTCCICYKNYWMQQNANSPRWNYQVQSETRQGNARTSQRINEIPISRLLIFKPKQEVRPDRSISYDMNRSPSFQIKRSRKFNIFPNSARVSAPAPQQKMKQIGPHIKPQGQSSQDRMRYDHLHQAVRWIQPYKNNLTKTFQVPQKRQKVINCKMMEKEGRVEVKPRETKMNSQFMYFDSVRQEPIVKPKVDSGFSTFLSRVQTDLRKSREKDSSKENPQTINKKKKRTKTKSKSKLNQKSKSRSPYRMKTETVNLQKYYPPWVSDLSQRLYDGGFRNKNYFAKSGKYSQKAKREYFKQIVDQSRYASKLLTPQEIQALFQQIAHSEPIPYWRSRIVAQESAHLQKAKKYERIRKTIN